MVFLTHMSYLYSSAAMLRRICLSVLVAERQPSIALSIKLDKNRTRSISSMPERSLIEEHMTSIPADFALDSFVFITAFTASLFVFINTSEQVKLSRLCFIKSIASGIFSSESIVKIKVEMEDKKLPLTRFGFSPFWGVYFEFTPSFIIRANAKIEAKASIETSVGFSVGTNGFQNLTKEPTVTSDIDIEGTVFVGLSFEPKVRIISDDIANAKMTAEIGGEITGKKEILSSEHDDDAYHCCTSCIDGDISVKGEISASASILNKKNLTFKVDLLKINIKLYDFYYSFDKGTGDFTECPYWRTNTIVNVTDEQGSPLAGATVRYGIMDVSNLTYLDFYDFENFVEKSFSPVDSGTADDNGFFTAGVDNDDFPGQIIIVEASKNKFVTQKQVAVLSHKPCKMTIKLAPEGASAGASVNASAITSKRKVSFADGTNQTAIKRVFTAKKALVSGSASLVITTDGTLYSCGQPTYNVYEKISDFTGTTQTYETYLSLDYIPLKVAENIVDVATISSGVGAITADGVLHTWGVNEELGPKDDPYFRYTSADSNGEHIIVAKAPLSGVKQIESDGDEFVAMVTVSDELLLCGHKGTNSNLRYGVDPNGSGDNNYGKFFEKVMDNVASISIGEDNIAAVTKDGSLYVWGDARVGDGTTEIRTVPTKIMDNIASVSLGAGHGAAVTNNGELYMWGGNRYGQLGIPNQGNSYVYDSPVKVMDNVAQVSLCGLSSAAVTKDGNLYTWGSNGNFGLLGTGTTVPTYTTPQKIMSDVASVSLAGLNGLAQKKDGSIWIWGSNNSGQLGNGTTIRSLIPIKYTIPAVDKPSGLVFALPEGATVSKPSIFSARSYASLEYSAQAGSANQLQQALFEGLIPNSVYNFYAMRSDIADDLLVSSNVLYMTQCVSDDSGNLTVNYNSDINVDDSIVFVKGIERIDFSKADIYTFSKYTSDSKVYAAPMVYYNDELLTEGRDYTVGGEYSSDVPGKYSITLTGKGDFIGSQTAEWELCSPNAVIHVHSGGTATCSTKAICEDCGEEYGEVNPENHVNTELQNAKAATETEDGYTGDTVCTDCNEVIETGTVIPKAHTVHTGGTASCSAKAICEVCGAEYGELDPDNHANTELKDEKAATCITKGYTGDTYCKDCGILIANGSETDFAQHSGGTATCQAKAICATCGQEYGEKNGNNHANTEIRDAVTPTCTTEGYTGDTYCTDCGAKVQTGTAISTTGHNWRVTSEIAATTSAEGKRIYTCSDCNVTREETIPKLTHPSGGGSSGGSSGGSGGGSYRPHTHRYIYDEEIIKEATCTENGEKSLSCSCGLTTTQSIPALGHNYRDEITKPATATENGIRTFNCTRCGHSYTEQIEKTGGDLTKPESGIPFIRNDYGNSGWDAIGAKIDVAKIGDTITVDMNETTVVPGSIFEKLKGKDLTAIFDIGDGIIWSVNGKDITSDGLTDIDLAVKSNTLNIPIDIVNNVTGERYNIQISLAYDGEFGFKATLSINLGRENAGQKATLYYYNNSELEFISECTIATDGTALLIFTHASDYLIVIGESKSTEGDTSDTSDTSTSGGDTSSSSTGNSTSSGDASSDSSGSSSGNSGASSNGDTEEDNPITGVTAVVPLAAVIAAAATLTITKSRKGK